MGIQLYTFEGGTLTADAVQQGAAVGPATKRVILSAALVNTTAAAVPATVYLVPASGAPGVANTIISGRAIAPGETYLCHDLINQGLNAGAGVFAKGAGLTFRYTAKDITNG